MRLYKNLLFLFIIISFSSCKFFKSNLMLRTPTDFTYDKIVDSLAKEDYKIPRNAFITVKIFSNDGFKIIDLSTTSNNGGANNIRFEYEYTVDSEGYVKLPLIGRIKIAGYTTNEAQNLLEQIYTTYYVKPFVIVKVTNKRVIVFPGNGGDAKVLGIANNNTTVLEMLALAGGIALDGKAYKVKLIRNENALPTSTAKPKVYLMDLSTIDGIAAGNTVVHANDIIYVEPRYRVARTLVTEIAPVLSLISTTLLIYSIFVKK
jgi:polysaccharide export outer membrane protein